MPLATLFFRLNAINAAVFTVKGCEHNFFWLNAVNTGTFWLNAINTASILVIRR